MLNLQLARKGLGSPLPMYSEPRREYSGMPVKLSETVHGCRWIIQHDRGAIDAWVCGAPCEEGHSYCAAHLRRVFVKKELEA